MNTKPTDKDRSQQTNLTNRIRNFASQSYVTRLIYQLFYQLCFFPQQLKTAWKGDNLFRITNADGIFFARPLTNTVAKTSPVYQLPIKQWITDAPEGVFIDIGAGVGGFVSTALHYGPADKAIAFEPNPSVYPLLLKHVSANDLSADVIHAAVTQDEGMMEMPPNTVHTQSSSSCGGSGVRVPTTSLDKFIADNEIQAEDIGCIRIASYGHELAALEGMQKTLHELKPSARVIVEITETGDPKDKTTAFIKWCGYELVDTSGKNHLFIKR